MMSDLQEVITSLLQEGYHILLGIDTNESIPLVHSIIKEGFKKFCIDAGLVDALTTLNGHCPIRSCSKSSSSSLPIDFILYSPGLIPFLRVGMMERLEGGPSDHNAFGIDINVGRLWQKIPRNSLRRSPWGFTVDNKRRTTKFVQAALELVKKAGMDELLGQLKSAIKAEEEESVIKELMEQTDGKLTECMLSAEKRVHPSAQA